MPGHPSLASVVVLAKHADAAKTRLDLPAGSARDTALRLASRTIRMASVAGSVGAVLVVTGDRRISTDALEAGAQVVWEGSRPLGMNRAAAIGRAQALQARPDAPVAILVADLPFLCPADLDPVVNGFNADGFPAFVADHHGRGTTMLIHGPLDRPGLAFGRQSAAMHRRLGYREVPEAGRGLRVDLDTPEDLAALRRHGPTSARLRLTRQEPIRDKASQ